MIYKLLTKNGAYLQKEAIKGYNQYFKQKNNTNVCNAPNYSLRFSHTGNILSCCYNRELILGTYPKNSLKEIWFGSKRKKLIKALKHFDFQYGCLECKKNIENKNYSNSGLHQYDYLSKEQLKKYPIMLDFEIGSTCNLECIMCNGEYSSTIRKNREKGKAYEEIYDEKFVEEFKDFIPFLKEARFVGGEPFLVKIHFPIWESIIKINPQCQITILTNGSIWNKQIENIFLKGNVHISFSIDSIDKKDYESIRLRSSLNNVLKNYKIIKEISLEKKRALSINMCLMRQNSESIAKTIEYFHQQEDDFFFHEVFYPFHTSLWNWKKDKLVNLLKSISSINLKKNSVYNSNSNKVTDLKNNLISVINRVDVINEEREMNLSLSYNELISIFKQKMILRAENKILFSKKINMLILTLEKDIEKKEIHKIISEMLLFSTPRLVAEIENISDQRILMKFKFAFG